MALKLKEADRIASIVRRSRVKFQLGFNRLFDLGYSKAKMMIMKASQSWSRLVRGVRSPGGIHSPEVVSLMNEYNDNEIDRFCDYISKDGNSPVSAEEGRASLQVALAARESARNKQVITIHHDSKTA